MVAADYTPTRRCTICRVEYPLTREYFSPSGKCLDGSIKLEYRCKACAARRTRIRYANNPDYRDRIKQKSRDRYANSPEYWREWYHKNRIRINLYRRIRYHDKYEHDPIFRERALARWRLHHNLPRAREKARSHRKSRYQSSPEFALRVQISNRVSYARRRSIDKNTSHQFSDTQWRFALEYFNYCCAVCGSQLNNLLGDRFASMDHWIPVTSPECPGTIATNIVPLCHGINGCNNSKGNSDPQTWLTKKFGARKASQILERIGRYFEEVGNVS